MPKGSLQLRYLLNHFLALTFSLTPSLLTHFTNRCTVRRCPQQLQELEEKYSECIEMLHEAQEELKNLRNRNYPAGTPRRYHPLGLYPMVSPLRELMRLLRINNWMFDSYLQAAVWQDSLAAEIEGTMRKELSLEDPECEEQKYVWMLHWYISHPK